MKGIRIGLCTFIAHAAVARADFTFSPFDVLIGDAFVSSAMNVGTVPAGSYSGYSLSVDWSAISGMPFSSEARWRLELPGSPVFLADPGASPDGANNGNATTLQWTGSFTQTYNAGDPLIFQARQTFQGSFALWDITLSLISGTVPPPTPPAATDIGALGTGTTSVNDTLATGQVQWFRFDTAEIVASAGTFLTIDTLGSTLAGGSFGDGNDSVIGLYNADGLRVAVNDDVDQIGGNLLSMLVFGGDPNPSDLVNTSGDLPAGTYYLAVAGFGADFGSSQFDVSSTSPVTGDFVLNFATNVPEPAMLTALLMASLCVVRKRII